MSAHVHVSLKIINIRLIQIAGENLLVLDFK